MTKSELKSIVENLMVDLWTCTNEDYQHLTLEECEEQLIEMRKYDIDLEPEERLPADMTAEELKTIWDEIVDEHWENLRSSAREYLLGEGNYDFPFNKYIEDFKARNGYAPHPWIYPNIEPYVVPFCGKDCNEPEYNMHQFAKLVLKSPDYDPDKPFYWYDGEHLHSVDHIYPDVIDVDVIVDYCIKNNTGLDYAIEELM